MKESFSSPKQSSHSKQYERNTHFADWLKKFPGCRTLFQEIKSQPYCQNSFALHKRLISVKSGTGKYLHSKVHKFKKETCSTLSAQSFKTGKRITKFIFAQAGANWKNVLTKYKRPALK